jgi:hypothetical protein
VWHLSVSVWSGAPGHERQILAPDLAEKEAVRWLRGVGNDREWWTWNDQALVGHLRVGVTDEEHGSMPCGIAEHDAGETGPERARTR